MIARIGGLGLIAVGWCTYLAALFSPAIEISESVLDGHWHEIMPGYRCFFYTVSPVNWIFAPLLLPYLLANGLVLMSPFFLLARWHMQRVFGMCLLAGFLFSMLAPWSYDAIRATYAGCFAWMASFAFIGFGFIWSSFSLSIAEPKVVPGKF